MSRHVLVTGASRGIGAAIAAELARRGFTVGSLTRKAVGIDGTVPIACDVDDEDSIKKAFRTLADKAGRIDGLVNNAGVHLYGKSAELATARYEEVMDTNARSVFLCSREAYPYLERAGGTIVNIGSFFDKLGVKQNLAYCASKAAVGAITRCLAVEWAPKKIRVLDVAPGYIETEMNTEAMRGPLGEFLQRRVPTGGAGGVEQRAEHRSRCETSGVERECLQDVDRQQVLVAELSQHLGKQLRGLAVQGHRPDEVVLRVDHVQDEVLGEPLSTDQRRLVDRPQGLQGGLGGGRGVGRRLRERLRVDRRVRLLRRAHHHDAVRGSDPRARQPVHVVQRDAGQELPSERQLRRDSRNRLLGQEVLHEVIGVGVRLGLLALRIVLLQPAQHPRLLACQLGGGEAESGHALALGEQRVERHEQVEVHASEVHASF